MWHHVGPRARARACAPRARAPASSDTGRRRRKARARTPVCLRWARRSTARTAVKKDGIGKNFSCPYLFMVRRSTARTALRAGDAARHSDCARAMTVAPKPRAPARTLARTLSSSLAAPPAGQAALAWWGARPCGVDSGVDSESLSKSRGIGTGWARAGSAAAPVCAGRAVRRSPIWPR